MTFDVATRQAREYSVSTPVYEGPLDLLLQLIERAELDITRLALAQVTGQYLAHLRLLEEQAAEEVSAFLVIAAKLVQIKSEALLPRPPAREPGEEEEDPGAALARQLIAYKRYKEIANILSARLERGLATYLRLAAPPKLEGRLDLEGVTLADLGEAAARAYLIQPPKAPLRSVVAAPLVTIREKIGQIVGALRKHGRVGFRTILGKVRSRLEVVVAFLAVLELVKRHKVAASQSGLFSEIEIETAENWQDDEDFELEFGE